MRADTYPMPEHGWTCFHCGEHFAGSGMGMRQARLHFGERPAVPPECLDANSPARKLARRARKAEVRAIEAYIARDAAEDEAASTTGKLADLRRLMHLERNEGIRESIDYLQGRVLAAEAVVGYIEKRFPGIVAKARQNV